MVVVMISNVCMYVCVYVAACACASPKCKKRWVVEPGSEASASYVTVAM